jgi:hypothetical protein
MAAPEPQAAPSHRQKVVRLLLSTLIYVINLIHILRRKNIRMEYPLITLKYHLLRVVEFLGILNS